MYTCVHLNKIKMYTLCTLTFDLLNSENRNFATVIKLNIRV